jgi:hypothetical protein
MRMDLHVHTSRYSPCGRSSPEEMVARAREVGLDGLVLTEHNVLWPEDEVMALRRQFPGLVILRGIEVTSSAGDDFLVYGVTDPHLFSPRMDGRELVRRAHAAGGVVVLAHPYRYSDQVPPWLEEDPVDGVEVWSWNILGYAHGRAWELARRLGAFALAASDAHQVDVLGLYALQLQRPVADERQLAQALREGAFQVVLDQPRLRALNAEIMTHLAQIRALIAEGYPDETIRERVPHLSGTMLTGIRQGLDISRPC